MIDFKTRIAMRRSDHEWAADLVDRFPRSWQARIMGRWTIDRGADDADWGERIGRIYPAANNALRERVDKLSNSARGGISPDAGDAEICVQADLTARDFQRRLDQVARIALTGHDDARVARVGASDLGWVRPDAAERAERRAWWHGAKWVERVQAFYCRHVLRQRGLLDLWPVSKKISRAGAVKRMQCARWWRRVYRKLHARTVEACGIGLGLVSRAAGLYASDEAVLRRGAQNFRNARALESVTAVNDHGQDYTLAELAAKGTANKVIRRGELLTRIAGFEHIAKDCGHVAYMVTVTCPSRFHKMTTRDGRVFDNPKYSGATPNEAQKYLSGQWAKFRAAAARAGLSFYGFRIAEPQHDATPHWHVLLFMPPMLDRAVGLPGRLSYRGLVSLVRRYFWRNDSASEPGAKKHRVDFERIDWNRGSAVGYVIKYVSKNIDGYGVGLDLFGNDAIGSSARVEAWAATWRIRQFQQIGGAPVGVWRELRRLHPDNLGEHAPDTLRDALSAINVGKIEPGIASLAWRKYNAAQGGVLCKRKNMRIKLLKESTGECGTYGEVMADRAVGIVAAGVHRFTDSMQIMVPSAPAHQRASFASVESERAAWLIVPGGRVAAQRAAGLVFPRSSEAASTRIHVNNCTQPARDATGARIVSASQDWRGAWMPTAVQAFAPVVEYRKKLRRFRQWAAASPPASIGDGRRQSPAAVLDLEWVAAYDGAGGA